MKGGEAKMLKVKLYWDVNRRLYCRYDGAPVCDAAGIPVARKDPDAPGSNQDDAAESGDDVDHLEPDPDLQAGRSR